MEARVGSWRLFPLGAQLACPRLDRREQQPVGRMGIAEGALVVGVTEHLTHREQIDPAVDHEARR